MTIPKPALIWSFFALLGFIITWETAVWLLKPPLWLVPAPHQVAQSLAEHAPLLLIHTRQTLLEALLGLLLALIGGVGLAVLMDRFARLRAMLLPLLVASQTIPIIVFAPLLAIWFGFGLLPKVLVVGLVCFFPIALSFSQGLADCPAETRDVLRSLGASYLQQLRWAKFPAALSAGFSGLRIATSYAVLGAIIAEWLGAKQGLGIYLTRAANSFDTATVFAIVLVIALVSLAMVGAVDALQRWFMPWQFSKTHV